MAIIKWLIFTQSSPRHNNYQLTNNRSSHRSKQQNNNISKWFGKLSPHLSSLHANCFPLRTFARLSFPSSSWFIKDSNWSALAWQNNLVKAANYFLVSLSCSYLKLLFRYKRCRFFWPEKLKVSFSKKQIGSLLSWLFHQSITLGVNEMWNIPNMSLMCLLDCSM